MSNLPDRSDEHTDSAAALREMLRKQVEELREKALRGEGDVESGDLHKALRLSRLAKLSESSKPETKRRRWPIIAMLAATLVIVSGLLFVRKSKTEIELNLKVSEVQFTVSTEQQITKTQAGIARINFADIDQVNLGGAPLNAQSTPVELAAHAKGAPAKLSTGVEQQAGKLTLAGINVPANTKVTLRYTDVPHQFCIWLETAAEKVEFLATIKGAIDITSRGFRPVTGKLFEPANQATFTAASNSVETLLTFPTAIEIALPKDLSINGIEFSQVEAFVSPTDKDNVHKLVSSITSGELYLGELGGKVINLRAAERLRIMTEPPGELRTIIVKDDAIELRFHGYVKEISAGSDEHPRSLMPTLLEWGMSQQGLLLLWATALYLFGLLMGVVRWWREKT